VKTSSDQTGSKRSGGGNQDEDKAIEFLDKFMPTENKVPGTERRKRRRRRTTGHLGCEWCLTS